MNLVTTISDNLIGPRNLLVPNGLSPCGARILLDRHRLLAPLNSVLATIKLVKYILYVNPDLPPACAPSQLLRSSAVGILLLFQSEGSSNGRSEEIFDPRSEWKNSIKPYDSIR